MRNAAPIIISLCALAFTIFSFYWLNFRRGKVIVSRPPTFAALGGSGRQKAYFYFPLVFYNEVPPFV